MLRQEINLYQNISIVSSSSRWLSWKILWLSNLVFSIFLTTSYFYSWAHIHWLDKKKAGVVLQEENLEIKFYRIRDSYPQVLWSQDINEAVNQLKQEIAMEKTILKQIENATPFSQGLLILAQIIVPNIWLTDIHFENGGQVIVLKGKSTNSSNVQKLLQNISHHKLFQQYKVNINNIEKVKEQAIENYIFIIKMVNKP